MLIFSRGDRMERGGGLMTPVSAEVFGEGYIILHRCIVCGATRKNKFAEGDDFNLIVVLSKRSI
ncbi:MAG: hypothetical protein A3C11_01190 [Candidatus Sungbacteria bacterium RIFCSPHIGHO2_02_FULL_49_12]|uniref:RNHCP domain-containing protein n=1 Tax=Candidatus Sungbacteria bacterium RIFCSPHIGHO2_02_FULL_49_12 TaxID=1802271 RepID=A0A1G2KPF8_9BACT|nr:MAG: hypothetical protein A3C11_01190 [Candidatus Sungbacteria bacterium RIFCSPHIGHO2_02_FULL_49_12]